MHNVRYASPPAHPNIAILKDGFLKNPSNKIGSISEKRDLLTHAKSLHSYWSASFVGSEQAFAELTECKKSFDRVSDNSKCLKISNTLCHYF